MRLAAAMIVAAIAWTACSLAGPVAPQQIALGQAFSLKTGESAQVAGGEIRVGVEGVTTDSRCPKGERCVWAGDAITRVWVQRGAAPRQVHELHTASGAAQAARVLDHELHLVRLDPYPISAKLITKADYVATLTLSRTAAADPDR